MSASPKGRPTPNVVPVRRRYPSDHTRAERRRRQRALGEARRQALEFAQRLQLKAIEAPDEMARRELFRVVRGIRIRFAKEENEQRRTVLKALESSELSTLAELVEKTGLTADCVQAILDDFASDRVGLVFVTTMSGKRKCGRKGTTHYYGLTD